MSDDDQPSWAIRRVRAMRAGQQPEPMPEPAEDWHSEAHAKCFREYFEGVGFCNTHGVSLVKAQVNDDAAKLAAATAALAQLSPKQLLAILTAQVAAGEGSPDPRDD